MCNSNALDSQLLRLETDARKRGTHLHVSHVISAANGTECCLGSFVWRQVDWTRMQACLPRNACDICKVFRYASNRLHYTSRSARSIRCVRAVVAECCCTCQEILSSQGCFSIIIIHQPSSCIAQTLALDDRFELVHEICLPPNLLLVAVGRHSTLLLGIKDLVLLTNTNSVHSPGRKQRQQPSRVSSQQDIAAAGGLRRQRWN